MGWGRGRRGGGGKAAGSGSGGADGGVDVAALPPGSVVDSKTGDVLVPVDTVSSGDGVATDSVEEVLAGNYSPDVVDEVRKYDKAEWDVEPSGLDPVDDIETFADYGFKLPPDAYDAYEAAKNIRQIELEELKAPPDPAAAAKIAARKELVEGKTAEEIQWLKHKAYYRGMQKIRESKAAARQQQQAAEAAAAAAAAAAAQQESQKQGKQQKQRGRRQQEQQEQPGPPLPVQQWQQQQRRQQQQGEEKLAHYSEDEVLAAVSEPSEWDMGWTAPGYQQHPEVLKQLRAAFSAGFGVPVKLSPAEEEAAARAAWRAAQEEAEEEEQQRREYEEAKAALIQSYMPYRAYTPEYLAKQRRQQVLASHRRAKHRAFWLSLTVAVGTSALRWWRQRGGRGGGGKPRRRPAPGAGGQQQQQQRPSPRPPTPSGMLNLMRGSIPE